MFFANYAWLIPIFPMIAFLVVGFLGNKLFKSGGGWFAAAMAGVACLLSLLVAFEYCSGTPRYRLYNP